MTPEQYDRIRAVYLEALSKPSGEREAFVHAACGEDNDLHREVESLLASSREADSFLQVPALGRGFDLQLPAATHPTGSSSAPRTVRQDEAMDLRQSGTCTSGVDGATGHVPSATVSHPARIGQYRILGVLGQGGMGIVYRAEQERPRRIVALKVIRPGIESSETLRRFEHESQVLACLQHPGIAQIYEAGTADTGAGPQPFFAMELVEGETLTQYAERHKLAVRQRLELICRICDAVHHAHQKGVVHRDLKPANILIDAAGQPKVLDFGVARATDGDLLVTTLQTTMGRLVGTVAYMSPEQVSGDPRQLDTRSDVYGLGVICYELLTGRTPIEIRQRTLPDAVRAVVEDEPTALGSINRLYRGDVETIIAKALEKDKERRYQSASELAQDIRRYLADQPITARPPTTLYQFRKFARRNRPLVAGILIAFVALLGGIVGTTSQALRAISQRDRALEAENVADQRRAEAEAQRQEALRQTAVARAINEFLNEDLLAAAKPEKQGRDVTVREVLDKASATVKDRFRDEPVVEAAVRQTLGHTYLSMGQYKSAEPHLQAAMALFLRELGEGDIETLKCMNDLAMLYQRENRLKEAEALCLRTIDIKQRVLGEDDQRTWNSLNTLANLYAKQRRHDEAEALYRHVLELRKRTLSEDHTLVLTSLNNLAALCCIQGRFEEAEPILKEALDLEVQSLGSEHPKTLLTMNNLASLYQDLKRYAESERLHVKTLEARRRVLGDAHPDTLVSVHNLARAYQQQDRLTEAEPLYREAMAGRRRVLSDNHPNTLASMAYLSQTLLSLGRFDEAESLALECHERLRNSFGPKSRYVRDAVELLVNLYEQAGRPEELTVWRARMSELDASTSRPTSQP